MKVRLSGLPEEAPTVVAVTVADVEAVVSTWTGIPVQRMTQDDRERLSRMEPALKVPCPCLLRSMPHFFNVACDCILELGG